MPRPVRIITVYEFDDGSFDVTGGGVGARRGDGSLRITQTNTTKAVAAAAVLRALDERDPRESNGTG